MAPEVTTTTWWPSACRSADLGAQPADGGRSRTPCRSVIDEVPILTTTIIGSGLGLVVERQVRRCAPCRPRSAPARASARSTPRRFRRPWATSRACDVAEVGEGHGPLGLAAVDHEGAVVVPIDVEGLGPGPVQDEGRAPAPPRHRRARRREPRPPGSAARPTSSSTPWPVTDEMSRSRPSGTRRRRRPGRPGSRPPGGGGRAGRAGTAAARPAGSAAARRRTRRRPGPGRSRMTSTRARSMWRRNWWPRPRPSLAPSMRPGMSATTNSASSVRTTPRFGSRVVNG